MQVYALTGVPPEIQAYAMAKYSRSAQSMRESIGELSAQRAEQFLDTFYFQYGHRSIADLAHIALAVEEISILAAIRVVDEPLWDGQERSTRYQNFRKSGYEIPGGLPHNARETYQAAAAQLFAEARALLPLATRTSVGQVISARVLERQISRLLAEPYDEVQAIGRELRQAAETVAESPTVRYPEPIRAAPTLVKYTAPAEYGPASQARVHALAAPFLARLPIPDRS